MRAIRGGILRRAFATALAVAGTCTAAGAKHVQEFPMGARGSIYIEVDDTWVDSSSRGGPIPTLRFETKTPGRMKAMITPVPTVDGRPPASNEVRAFVESAAEERRAEAVEKSLPLTAMRGAETKGFRFRATDRSPKPGEYRFLYQGAVAAGAFFVTFTVLFNEAGEEDARKALSSIQNIRVASKRI
jgi:hypothetical protein